MNPILKSAILPLLFLPVFFSCSSTKKISSAGAVNGLPSLHESVINIPVKIYAKPFIAKAESLTPKEFTSTGWPDFQQSGCDFRYKYRFIRSGLRVACVNNKATITLVGNYQLAGSTTMCAFGKQVSPWISGSCGFSPESMRRVEINIASLFHFQPDYTVRSRSGVEKINAMDKCLVSLLNSDITQQVIDSIRSSANTFSVSLDQTISQQNISPFIRRMGEKAGRKIALSNYGYIKVNPSAVRIGSLNYAKDTLYLTLGFACYPEVSSDSNNRAITSFLPPLTAGDLTDGFDISTNAIYDYVFIDSLLTRYTKNKSVELKGQKFIIKNMAVRGLENNMIELAVGFSGSKTGILYLTGTPVLDASNQVITIPDLDYSLRSKDLVLNLGKTFFNKKIIAAIRERAMLKIGDLYRQNKTKLDAAFNRTIAENMFSYGNTTDIRLTGLAVKKDNLVFQLRATGNIHVTVGGKAL